MCVSSWLSSPKHLFTLFTFISGDYYFAESSDATLFKVAFYYFMALIFEVLESVIL